eukprot:416752-Hanusia_phi.AAC.1
MPDRRRVGRDRHKCPARPAARCVTGTVRRTGYTDRTFASHPVTAVPAGPGTVACRSADRTVLSEAAAGPRSGRPPGGRSARASGSEPQGSLTVTEAAAGSDPIRVIRSAS